MDNDCNACKVRHYTWKKKLSGLLPSPISVLNFMRPTSDLSFFPDYFMSLGKNPTTGYARLNNILTLCTKKTRRTFTVGRPPYAKSGYSTGNFRKLWPRCASSSHLNRQKRTFNTIKNVYSHERSIRTSSDPQTGESM